MLPDDAHSAFRVVSLSSCCSTVMTNQTCHRLFGSVRDHTTSHWSSALLRSTLPSSSFPFTLPLPPFPLREPKTEVSRPSSGGACCWRDACVSWPSLWPAAPSPSPSLPPVSSRRVLTGPFYSGGEQFPVWELCAGWRPPSQQVPCLPN